MSRERTPKSQHLTYEYGGFGGCTLQEKAGLMLLCYIACLPFGALLSVYLSRYTGVLIAILIAFALFSIIINVMIMKGLMKRLSYIKEVKQPGYLMMMLRRHLTSYIGLQSPYLEKLPVKTKDATITVHWWSTSRQTKQ